MCGSEIIAVRTALSAVENYPIYFGMTGGRKIIRDTLGTAGRRELFDILGGYVLISFKVRRGRGLLLEEHS